MLTHMHTHTYAVKEHLLVIFDKWYCDEQNIMTNILPGSSSYYMLTVMIRSMWDIFACCLVTLYRIHYSGFDLLHPNI